MKNSREVKIIYLAYFVKLESGGKLSVKIKYIIFFTNVVKCRIFVSKTS